MVARSHSRSVAVFARAWALALLAALPLTAGGCTCTRVGADGGGPGGDGGTPGGDLVAIIVTPANEILDVSSTLMPSVVYTAMGQWSNGATSDLTGEVMWFVDHPLLGSFAGNVFTASGAAGGETRVHAWHPGESVDGATDLTLRIRLDFVRPGAPADAPTWFTGPAGGVAPGVVYPNDGVLLPPNLRLLEIHWLPGGGNTLFELSFTSTPGDIRIYTSCDPLGPGCGFELSEAEWTALAETNRGSGPVSLEVRGVASTGGAIGTSPPRSVRFSNDDLLGGLYYWAATPGSIMRYDFGLAGQSAESYYTAAEAGGICVGCHALSRAGDRMAAGVNIPSPAGLRTIDVATRGLLWSGTSNFMTFSPDSSKLITSNGISMDLRDAASGTVLQMPLVANGTMPDWSPDGLSVVFARPSMMIPCFPGFCGAPGIDGGSLFLLATDGTSFGPEAPLAAESGFNYYYPAFSPDGDWVLFNRSALNSFDAPDAQLYAIAADGTGVSTYLAAADEGIANSWPKWAPFVTSLDGGPLMWFAFSSRRDYGLRLMNSQLPMDMRRAQIWMAAFNPTKGLTGADPSFPGFWLPYQDLTTGNHIPQWSEEVVRMPCMVDTECGAGEFCDGMVCLPLIR